LILIKTMRPLLRHCDRPAAGAAIPATGLEGFNMIGLRRAIRCCLAAMMVLAALPAPSRAQTTGTVVVEVGRAGFIVGVGGGRGVLTFQGRRYPFSVGGLSVGLTIGASKAELIGRARNLRQPSDLAGTYTAVGAGIAIAGGAQGIRLQNAKGVVLELLGRRAGFDFSAGVGGVTITMQ
jgi:hypothetical protein